MIRLAPGAPPRWAVGRAELRNFRQKVESRRVGFEVTSEEQPEGVEKLNRGRVIVICDGTGWLKGSRSRTAGKGETTRAAAVSGPHSWDTGSLPAASSVLPPWPLHPATHHHPLGRPECASILHHPEKLTPPSLLQMAKGPDWTNLCLAPVFSDLTLSQSSSATQENSLLETPARGGHLLFSWGQLLNYWQV